MSAVRVYMIVMAQTTTVPTENQWRAVFARVAQDGVLTKAIRLAARRAENQITAEKRNRGTGAGRITLVGFEMHSEDVDNLLAISNAQAAARGLTGTTEEKFVAVITRELREAAVALGFSQAQANQISIPVYHYAPREEAIAAVRTYLAQNSSVWYAGDIL